METKNPDEPKAASEANEPKAATKDPNEPQAATTDTDPRTRPVLRILNGDAAPEEIAAVVAVVAALGTGGSAAPKPAPEWSAPHRCVRRPLLHGPGGWRSSGLPR